MLTSKLCLIKKTKHETILSTGRNQAEKKDGLELSREISIKGTNPYRLSAGIISTLSKSLACEGNGIPKGVINPSMVKGHKEIVSISEKYGCRWQLL